MSYDSVVLADSPAAYFKLQETVGTTLTDSSGNSVVGGTTAVGVTYNQTGAILSDPNSRSLLFDGTSGFWQAVLNLSAGHTFTFECWLKMATLGSGAAILMEIPTTGFTATAGGALVEADGSSVSWQQFAHGWCTVAGTQSTVGYQATNPALGVFHHLVFTWDYSLSGSTAQMKLYVDSVLQTPTSLATANATQNVLNGTFSLMARGNSTLFRSGNMGNAAFYPTVLSASQVLAHYAAAFPSPPPMRRVQQAAMRAATW